MEKILNKHFFISLVVVIIIFFLLLNHYSWWIALFNSIIFVIVGVLLERLEPIINRNRNRDIPRWFTALIIGILTGVICIFKSYFSNIEFLWFLIFAAFIVKIVFPEIKELPPS